MKFKSSTPVKNLEVYQDVLLPTPTSSQGQFTVLRKGVYPVINNEIFFNGQTSVANSNARIKCLTMASAGSFLGFDYSYNVTVCWGTTSAAGKSTIDKGCIIITPQLNERQKRHLQQNETAEFHLKENIDVNQDGVNFTIKAGTYQLNQNGSAYLIGQKLN